MVKWKDDAELGPRSAAKPSARTSWGSTAALVIVALAAIVVLAELSSTYSSKPGFVRLALSSSHAAPRSDSSSSGDPWLDEAARNLTDWRRTAMSKLWSALEQPHKRAQWELFKPIIGCPAGRPLRKYGVNTKPLPPRLEYMREDGVKLLCSLDKSVLGDKHCVVYSLGSKGQLEFEESILQETNCEVHTFDCTWAGRSLDNNTRHFYHQWCLGSPRRGRRYRSWRNVTAELGHADKVDVLKMDIEGHEYSVLQEFKFEDRLPLELSIELHTNAPHKLVASILETFRHLAALGYATYSYEVNRLAPDCCSEFTLARVVRP